MPLALPTPVPCPTRPYWLEALPPSARAPRPSPASHAPPAQRLPEVADVVIIGGGICGVSAAYHLRKTRPELQVVLLEARQLSHGATGRNGGLLWPALNAPWARTAARYGEAEAQRMMQFEVQCLQEVTEFIKANSLEQEVCYAPFKDGAYYVYDTQAEMEAELAELALMQQAGIHTDVKPLGRREASSLLGTDAFAGVVAQPGVARVWAARLVHALARMALASGPPGGLVLGEGQRVTAVEPLGELLEPAAEREVAERLARAAAEAAARTRGGRGRQGAGGAGAGTAGGEGVANNIVAVPQGALQTSLATQQLDPMATPLLQVTTESGSSLLARRVLHCTNAYGSALLPELRSALVPVRNHVAATRAPGGGNGNGGGGFLPVDAAFYGRGGYVYWSTREDGRIVLGGFRDVVPDMEWGVWDDGALHPEVTAALRAYLPARWPGRLPTEQQQQGGPALLEAEAAWSGILGFTQDRFPFVGPVPGRRGQFLAAGFSGHGMTRTFTCGRVLADMVAGQPLDPAFPPTWLPAEGRFGAATPAVPGPEAAAGAVYC